MWHLLSLPCRLNVCATLLSPRGFAPCFKLLRWYVGLLGISMCFPWRLNYTMVDRVDDNLALSLSSQGIFARHFPSCSIKVTSQLGLVNLHTKALHFKVQMTSSTPLSSVEQTPIPGVSLICFTPPCFISDAWPSLLQRMCSSPWFALNLPWHGWPISLIKHSFPMSMHSERHSSTAMST